MPWRYFYLLLAAPAVGAELAGLKRDGFDHVIETMVVERGEVQFLADPVHLHVWLLEARAGAEEQEEHRC